MGKRKNGIQVRRRPPFSSLKKSLHKRITTVRYWFQKYLRRVKISGPGTFIVGCGHSGTSILLAILDAHPKLYAVPNETAVGIKQKSLLVTRFEQAAIAAGKERWVEKTAKHIRCIDKLLAIAPGAKILLIIRDGRDVACSIQDRTGNLESGITRWVEDIRAGQKYWNHPSVFVLRYESLTEDFNGVVTSVLDFLGEEFAPAMRHYYKTRRYYHANVIAKPPTRSETIMSRIATGKSISR